MTATSRAVLAFAAVVVLSQGNPFASAQPFKPQAREVPRFEADASWAKLPEQMGVGPGLQRLDRRAGPRLDPAAPELGARRSEKHGRAAGAGVRRGRQFRPGLGRTGRRLRLARDRARHLRRPEGLRLARRQRQDRPSPGEVHQGRQVRHADRPQGPEQGQQGHRERQQAADTFVHAPTNELFVADGYGNRRVVVFDADTGAFKRMWGAFGNEPLDKVPPPPKVPEDQRIPAQGSDRTRARPVHHARACGAGLERRARLRLRPRRQARAGVHARRQVRHAGVHRPLLRGAALRQRADRREHGVLARSGAALPVRRQPQPGAGLGARSQDAPAARFVRTARRRARRVLRPAPHERRREGQPVRDRGAGRQTHRRNSCSRAIRRLVDRPTIAMARSRSRETILVAICGPLD